MRHIAIILVCVATAACPGVPPAPLQACNPETCSDPGKTCESINGVDLCVYSCADPADPAGRLPCHPDQFAQTVGGTCTCVPREPSGRSCTADDQCGLAPDTAAAGTTFLCAGPAGNQICLPAGTACDPGATTPYCAAGQRCDPVLHLCTTCGGAEVACNDQDDDCDPATPDQGPSEVSCNGLDDDCNAATADSATEVCGNGIDEDCSGGDAVCRSMIIRAHGGFTRLRVSRVRPLPARPVCVLTSSGICDLESNLEELGAATGVLTLEISGFTGRGKISLVVDGAVVASYRGQVLRRPISFTARLFVDRSTRRIRTDPPCPAMICSP